MFVKTDIRIIYSVKVYFEVGIVRDVLGLKNKFIKAGSIWLLNPNQTKTYMETVEISSEKNISRAGFEPAT